MIKDLPAASGPATGRLRLTPARRVILAVGVPVAIALIGGLAFSLVTAVGQGSYPVNYAIPVSGGRVTMNFGGGDLTLRGTDSGAARLTGTVDYSLVRPHLSLADPGGRGAVFTFTCGISTGNCALNGTADVPSGTSATVSTGGGDLTASDLTGGVSLSSGGGNLAATHIAGHASLQTGGGDLTAAQLTGDADLGTGGGNITATSIGSPRVTADSGGGDIEIVFTRVPQDVQVSADGGDVTIVVPSGHTAYHVTANPDGGNLNDGVPQATSSSHVITASSGGGDITIEQST
ncbi:MAG: DUF4097 family beta strand repeat-containing protein [Trebonia sp.]|jgi:hypothetical protein